MKMRGKEFRLSSSKAFLFLHFPHLPLDYNHGEKGFVLEVSVIYADTEWQKLSQINP